MLREERLLHWNVVDCYIALNNNVDDDDVDNNDGNDKYSIMLN